MSTAIYIFVGLAAIPWHGFVYAQLWGWFAVPLGLPAVGMWHALGVAVLFRLLTLKGYPRPDNKNEAFEAVATWVYPLLSLGFGWFYQAMMQ
jgi:hypothetical protein